MSYEYSYNSQFALGHLWDIPKNRKRHWTILGVFWNFADRAGVSAGYVEISQMALDDLLEQFESSQMPLGHIWNIWEHVWDIRRTRKICGGHIGAFKMSKTCGEYFASA
eukprot:1096193-Pyramimonas_sp.AAC.1